MQQKPGLLRWFAVLACLHLQARAFNLELRYPHVYHSNKEGDYFGFSVALHAGSQAPTDSSDTSWMMVGAPRRNRSDAPLVHQPGQVMNCPLGARCVPLDFNLIAGDPPGKPDGSMFGSAQDMLGGRFVTCAPRWRGLDFKEENYTMPGVIYWGGTEQGGTVEKILPLDKKDSFTRIYRAPGSTWTKFPVYQYGQAGFSAHFPNITQGLKEMVLGAPGAYNWKGTTVMYRDNAELDSGVAKRRRKRAIGIEAFAAEPIIPDSFGIDFIKTFGLFGYAVSSGRFYTRGTMLQVAGAPRAATAGNVLIYTFPSRTDRVIKVFEELKGQQMGEYFGASLAACNIDGDPQSLDDLVVGAPLYSSVQDEGRVYVFLGSPTKKLMRATNTAEILGSVPNGRFGYAISCIGDINRDGFHDVAIAAPYEGGGVVYIYNGGHGGFSARPPQRVEGSVVAPGARGFGFSLSRGQDMDGNGYNDIAVGAYKSGHAVLLRARPVVEFIVEFNPLVVGGLPRDSTFLRVEACVKYMGFNMPQKLNVVQSLKLDPVYRRLYIMDNQSTEAVHESRVTLLAQTHVDNFNCFNINISIVRVVQKFLEPISLSVEYQLIPDKNEYKPVVFEENSIEKNKQDLFRSDLPVMKLGHRALASTQVRFVTECGADEICNSQLSISVNFRDKKSNDTTFIVDSAPSLFLRITVTNADDSDPAYSTQVEISLPVRTVRLPSQCQENSVGNRTNVVSQLTCNVANPLNKGFKRDLDLELYMQGVLATQESLQVHAKAVTTSKDKDKDDNEVTYVIALSYNADMTVSGKPGNEIYLFEPEGKEETNVKTNVSFSISYQVEKFGVSRVDKVLLSIKIPVAMKSGQRFLYLPHQPELMLNLIPLECKSNYLLPSANSAPDLSHQDGCKREADDSLVQGGKEYPSNRTLYVECSPEAGWQCEELRCVAGPFPDNSAVARLELAMLLDVSVLESFLNMKDIMLFRTEATLEVLEPANLQQPPKDKNRPDCAIVAATFLGRLPVGHVEPWVIALSVIAGVLLLVALVTALIKTGFFVRKDKDALEELKNNKEEGSVNPTQIKDQ